MAGGRAVLAGGRVGAEELDSGQLGMENPEAVGDDLMSQVTRKVDQKAVVTESPLRRSGLEFGQVDAPGRKLTEDGVKAPWSILTLEADDARLVVSCRSRDAGRGQGHEPCLVVGVILYRRGQD